MNLNSTFLEKFLQQSVETLKLAYPDKTEGELRDYVINKIESARNSEKFNNIYKVSERDPLNKDHDSDILSTLDYLEDEKPIITGFGALYEQHTSGTKNILLEMVQMLLDIRKVYKKKKLAHANDDDKSLFELYDKYQLVYKLLNNSFFGAAGQPQSIFFDPYFPSSIMYTGQIIIMTAITTFEKLTGNFNFTKLDDCTLYINRILKQDYITDLKLNIHPSKDEVFEHLKSKFEEVEFNEDVLNVILSSLNQSQLDRLYYKNNFLKFIDNDEVKNLLSEVIKYEFLDVNEVPKELAPYINTFWDWTREYCMYEFIPTNRTDFCHTHTRKTVLTVDTDSNFLYNKPFTSKLREFFPTQLSEYNDNKAMKLSCINISMYIYTKLIGEGYEYMGKMLNIDKEHRPIINMKNEFAYERIMTTPAKKHYAGMLMAQEGIVLTGSPEKRLDMKGLALRKSSLNRNIRDYFTTTLINKILLPEKINLSDVYSDFEDMENTITNSLLNGELSYCQPGKVNSIDKYVSPFTIQTLRGTLLWNSLFPDKPIMPPEKINYVKIKPINYKDFINQIPDQYKESVIRLYSKHVSNSEGSKSLADYDINILCFPKSLKKIPDFLAPFIDIDIMVHDQIKAAMEIIVPLGFKSLDILDKSFSTNMINV